MKQVHPEGCRQSQTQERADDECEEGEDQDANLEVEDILETILYPE